MLLTPAYKLTIGDRLIDTTDEPKASTLVSLTVRLDMDTAADSATLTFGNASKPGGSPLDPKKDDETAIELGYEGETFVRVHSGRIASVDRSIQHKRVIALTGGDKLLSHYIDQTFEQKTAGEIVKDLCGQAGVTTGTIQDGPKFPAYVIDSRRSFHHHMHDLASLCGFELYFNPQGQLMFERFVGGRDMHVFEFKKHIVALHIEESPASYGTVEAWGESPGASSGDDSWAWLTKDFKTARGSSGNADPKLIVERPALRTAAAAALTAEGFQRDAQARGFWGHVLTYGRPGVKLGDSLKITEAPEERLNSILQIRAIEHRITKTHGFTTEVEFRGFF